MDQQAFRQTIVLLSGEHSLSILRALRDGGWHLSSEVARTLHIHISTASKFLHRFGELGLLERRPHDSRTSEYRLRNARLQLELDLEDDAGPLREVSTSTSRTSIPCSSGSGSSGRRRSRWRWSTGSPRTTRSSARPSSIRWSRAATEASTVCANSSRRCTGTSGACARRASERTRRKKSSGGPSATRSTCIRTSQSGAA